LGSTFRTCADEAPLEVRTERGVTATEAATLAARLAGFVADLAADDIPPDVRSSAQWHVMDSVGVALAGAHPEEGSGQAVAGAAARWQVAGGGSTVLGLGARARPEAAALLNGALMQALEMDDKHAASLARPGSTVTPAVLAVAEAEHRSLGAAITAIVAGYETMIRLGFVGGKRFLDRGYHTSSLLGAFGAAAAVGRLRGLDAGVIGDALGIAGTFAAGIQEATRTGSTSKILHGGWGAHCGIIAVDLASAGITGPTSVFEGDYGFFAAHLAPLDGALDWGRATADLGTEWYLPATAYKPYPCCQLLHSFIEAAKVVRAELAVEGVDLASVERIRAGLAEPGRSLVTLPLDRKTRPEEPHEARFSLPYVVASALVHGHVDLDTFRTSALADPEVRQLAARVEAVDDPESDYPVHDPAVLEVTAGGRHWRHRIPYHPGSPEAPVSPAGVIEKFVGNAGWLIGPKAAEFAIELAEYDHHAPVEELIALIPARIRREETQA
jgi:2-methylcitrate dehydratase PrpD